MWQSSCWRAYSGLMYGKLNEQLLVAAIVFWPVYKTAGMEGKTSQGLEHEEFVTSALKFEKHWFTGHTCHKRPEENTDSGSGFLRRLAPLPQGPPFEIFKFFHKNRSNNSCWVKSPRALLSPHSYIFLCRTSDIASSWMPHFAIYPLELSMSNRKLLHLASKAKEQMVNQPALWHLTTVTRRVRG